MFDAHSFPRQEYPDDNDGQYLWIPSSRSCRLVTPTRLLWAARNASTTWEQAVRAGTVDRDQFRLACFDKVHELNQAAWETMYFATPEPWQEHIANLATAVYTDARATLEASTATTSSPAANDELDFISGNSTFFTQFCCAAMDVCFVRRCDARSDRFRRRRTVDAHQLGRFDPVKMDPGLTIAHTTAYFRAVPGGGGQHEMSPYKIEVHGGWKYEDGYIVPPSEGEEGEESEEVEEEA